MKLIATGAEAWIFLDEKRRIIKERIKKNYRLEKIDKKLREQRTRLEASLLDAARRAGVRTPQIFERGDTKIIMEFIEGQKVKEALNEDYPDIADKIGQSIARLHQHGIIHGDLTTSNMIVHNGKIYFIDFGLGFNTSRTEDQAIDLYLLKRALESTHWKISAEIFATILKSYKNVYGKASYKVINLLPKIEKRGRYRKG